MTIVIEGTNQEIFDKIVKHLAEQKGPALDMDGECVYRTEDGGSCAVGCLISDKDYTPNLEGQGIISLLVMDAVILKGPNKDMMNCLQATHDLAEDLETLKKSLISIADDYRLNSDSVSLITEWNVPND